MYVAILKSIQFPTCAFNNVSMIIGVKYTYDRHICDVPSDIFAIGRALTLPMVRYVNKPSLMFRLGFFSRDERHQRETAHAQ